MKARMRRTVIKSMAAVGLLGAAGVSGLIRNVLADEKRPMPSGLRSAKGEVKVNGQPVLVGHLIRPGDTVTTGPDGEAIYVIGKDAFLQRGNSSVGFGLEGTKKLMRVIAGRILSVFGQGEMEIKVSTATIGIRGTGCYIEDEPLGPPSSPKAGTAAAARTYFCLCYGSVELTPNAAPHERESYSTTHHDKPMYIWNDMSMPRMMVPAGVENHKDAELTLLEALVSREPPFLGKVNSFY
jgi:hypothetical protein